MNQPILVLEDLHFCREGRRQILSGINLRISPSDIIGLTGNNGTGKSTLLSCITGLLPIQKGTIELLGKPIHTAKDFQFLRSKVGYALQNPADQIIFPEVLEDAAFGPRNLGLPDPVGKARLALEKLGLSHLADADPGRLSGGQTRLAALAGIIAMDPALLLLDEPLTGLDADSSRRVIDLIQELPCAKLVVYHENAPINQVCTRIFVLKDGKLQDFA